MKLRKKHLIITALVIVIFLSVLPEAGRYYVINKITQQGFDNVTIEDVDLNLFTGSLQIENVRVGINNEEKLVIGLMRADYRWQGIFSGGIATELFEIQDTKLAVIEDDNGNLEVVIPVFANEQNKADEPSSIEADQSLALPNLDVDLVRLANIEVNIQLKQFTGRFDIHKFTLTRVSTWHDYPAELTLESRLNDTTISAKLTAQPLATTPSVQGDISIKNIQFDDFKTLSNTYSPYPLDSLQGTTDVDLYVDGVRDTKNNLTLNFSGDMIGRNVHVASNKVAVKVEEFTPNFSIKLQAMKDTTLVTGTVNSNLQKFSIIDEINATLLIQLEKLHIDNLTVSDELSVSVESIDFSGISWFNNIVKKTNKTKDHANINVHNKLDKLNLENIQLDNSFSKLSLDKLELAGLQASLQLNEQNKPNWLKIIEKIQERFPEKSSNDTLDLISENEYIEEVVEENLKSEFLYDINTITLSAPTHINLVKTLKSQPHKIQLDIEKLLLTNLTNSKVEKESNFELNTKLNKHASISVKGSGYLTQQPINLSLAGKIEDMSFVTLSPFIESFAGYQFTRGQFDHEFKLQLQQNEIEMSNDVVIRRLQVKDIDESKVVSTLPIPMAISVLEDSKGIIDIEIPVKGNLNDANVNVNSIIQKSITQAVKKGSIGFLKYALQPYGAAFMAAEYLVDASNRIAFDDMTFNVNSSSLDLKQLDYANKLIEVLSRRDEIDLHLCGKSNQTDKAQLINEYQGELLAAQLTALAKQRAISLKAYLSEKGVANKRLFLCKAKYEQEGTSGVTISME